MVSRVPPESESDLLQVALRCRFHDFAADEGTACEGDLFNPRTFDDCMVDGDGVDDARGTQLP